MVTLKSLVTQTLRPVKLTEREDAGVHSIGCPPGPLRQPGPGGTAGAPDTGTAGTEADGGSGKGVMESIEQLSEETS